MWQVRRAHSRGKWELGKKQGGLLQSQSPRVCICNMLFEAYLESRALSLSIPIAYGDIGMCGMCKCKQTKTVFLRQPETGRIKLHQRWELAACSDQNAPAGCNMAQSEHEYATSAVRSLGHPHPAHPASNTSTAHKPQTTGVWAKEAHGARARYLLLALALTHR